MLFEALAILLLCLLALPALLLSGALNPRKIAGPPRLAQGESFFTPFAILLLSACCGVLSAVALSRLFHFSDDENLVLLMAGLYAVFLTVAITLTVQMRPAGLRHLGLGSNQLAHALKPFLTAAFAVLPLVYASMLLVQIVIELTHHQLPAPHPMLEELSNHPHSLWFVATVFEVVFLVPLAEETLFRGLLQTTLLYSISRQPDPSPPRRWLAVIVTAAFFAVAHGEPAFFLPLFVLACGLGYLYERTGSLWPCVLLHGGFNALQIALFLGVTKQ